MLACLPCQSSSSNRSSTHQQRGTVLVLVLFIVALVAALSVKFAAQYQLGLARAETRWHGAQARAFLEGTEEVAKLMFAEVDRDQATDFLGEGWDAEFPIEDEGVSGVAKLTDATTQLNLNDLGAPILTDKPMGSPERYTSEQQKRFIRLLQTFPDMPLGQDQAEYLLEAVVDWMDQDEAESGQGGAEANFYQSMPEPYRPADAPFKSVEELRLVRGFHENPQLVLRLTPFITVLPQPNVGLNINTIEPVIPGTKILNSLLLAINDSNSLSPAPEADLKQILTARPETGFADQGAIQTVFPGKNVELLNVKATFFWLNASVQLVDQRRSMRSLMTRDEFQGRPTLKVIQREDVYELPSSVRRGDEEDEDDDGETELVE